MAGWYNRVVSDLSLLPDCIVHFEAELDQARRENLTLRGRPLEKLAAELPGIVEQRYGQLQEIEAILEHLNIELRKIRSEKFKHYLERYQRALSSRDVEKYVDGESDVVNMAVLINEFALLRNKWLGLLKSVDIKHWQINNIVKLRTAGLDDATL